jgi:hypothetical protein
VGDSQTTQAWARVAEHYRVTERLALGEVIALTAQGIKDVSGREPRLMTKFDTRESRPKLLANATILPTTNGAYLILPGDGYADLREEAEVKPWRLPEHAADLRTLPWASGPSSESQALDMALAAGILGDFLDDGGVRLTVRGRRRAPPFNFGFRCSTRTENVSVDGVQVEVDSGLEGDAIHLVEGKLGSRTNFHVRQLYYPLRMWMTEIPTKEVNAVFMSWSNKRFALRKFAFTPVEDYHAIQVVKALDYVLEEEETLPSLANLMDRTAALGALPPDVPFPQADDIRRVIDVVDAIATGRQTKAEITELYDFDKRQADYYANAAIFLGMVERSGDGFGLSDLGRALRAATLVRRTLLIAGRVASLPVFRDSLGYILDRRHLPQYNTVEGWITARTGLTGATPRRRAATVLSWTRWVAVTFGLELTADGQQG